MPREEGYTHGFAVLAGVTALAVLAASAIAVTHRVGASSANAPSHLEVSAARSVSPAVR